MNDLFAEASRSREGSLEAFSGRRVGGVEWTHFDASGASRMVDVSGKAVSVRTATAGGRVRMEPETLSAIRERRAAKGDVLEVARLAGIMAAKRTGELIPLCHPLGLDSVRIEFHFVAEDSLAIEAEVKTTARTGVEMEALTAVSIAALTVYDMCKAVDRGMTIERVQLEAKRGGKSGDYVRPEGSVLPKAEPRAEAEGGAG